MTCEHQIISFADGEFPVKELHGIGLLETCQTLWTSAGRNWKNVYVSTQIEAPYEGFFRASPHLFVGLVRSGSAKMAFNLSGEERSTNLRPGQALILPAGKSFKVKLDGYIHTTHTYIRNSFLNAVATDIYQCDLSSVVFNTEEMIQDPLLEGLITAISDAVEFDSRLPDIYAEHLARAFSCHILHRYSSFGPLHQGADIVMKPGGRRFAHFRALIETHINQKLSLADMAAGSGMTTGHFARVFRDSTGMTPYQYLLHCRIERARHLLVRTSLPILQIASECGFADHVHFTRVFSKMVGQPPAAFRKTIRE